MTTATLTDPTVSRATLSAIEAEVLRHLRSVRYGQITVQIHDARIVQIERTEKIRPDQRHD
ncbi:MAG TPA: YezD family protein [Planctomycetota bacterium]|jgi:hypothetical protein|nr:YezD family protein [Planctomycetota bacterium]